MPELLEPEPWEPGPAEVLPEAKVLAARIARELTTYPYGSTPAEVAERALGPGKADLVPAGLVDPAAVSAGRVVYPQLVGAGEDRASVTVLVERMLRRIDEGESLETLVLDVRLERGEEGEWRLAALPSAGGPPAPASVDLPSSALAVLDHPRIHLPVTGRRDIRRGEVHPELLELMLGIADRHEIHVLTLVSGRPRHVFGTDRLSRHASGRAVDIYAVDGVLVVEQQVAGTPAHRLTEWLFELGAPEIGSPWALDGFGGRSFTDLVHRDHLHVAVDP